MAIDFPGNPNVDDTYTSGGITWIFNGTKWVTQTNTNLNDLTNVDTAGVEDGNTLVYNAGTNKWEPGSSGGSYATTVAFGF